MLSTALQRSKKRASIFPPKSFERRKIEKRDSALVLGRVDGLLAPSLEGLVKEIKRGLTQSKEESDYDYSY